MIIPDDQIDPDRPFTRTITRPIHHLVPGQGCIGILGAGQLGAMLARSCTQYGLRPVIFSDVRGPACQAAGDSLVAHYSDENALRDFAARVDVITLEFENIPLSTLEFLADLRPTFPGTDCLAVTQDRWLEKTLAQSLGAQTAACVKIDSLHALRAALAGPLAPPAILKTRRLGYDGKGQVRIHDAAQAQEAWETIKGAPAILEALISFDREISVIATRDQNGNFLPFDIPENEHRDQILRKSTVPARIDETTRQRALEITRNLGDALSMVGTFAVEFFVEDKQQGAELRVNEIAPRVHNSGHWTLDACSHSQFDNHIRALAGWPLGATTRFFDVEMRNLIGDDMLDWPDLAGQPDLKPHFYGKPDILPGRKMGHVCRLFPKNQP